MLCCPSQETQQIIRGACNSLKRGRTQQYLAHREEQDFVRVCDDGTHVHTSCGNYTDDEYNNRHSHDDDDAHAHPTHEFSEGNCIVHHAATPSQLCPSGDGLQYYFIGADGSSQTGPYLPNQSSDSPAIQLYSGSNPMTGKSVVINWETDNGGKLRLSTYYPDNEYDTDKPYVFTVTENNIVTHVSW